MSEIKIQDYLQKLVNINIEEEKYKNELKVLKEKKENLSNVVISYMEKNNILNKNLQYSNNVIKYKEESNIDSITKKLIQIRLTDFLKNEKQAIDATNYIYSNRNRTTKRSINITHLKINKNIN